MKKLRKVEELLEKDGGGFTITGQGEKCKCHGLEFCPTPLTEAEKAKLDEIAPKGTY